MTDVPKQSSGAWGSKLALGPAKFCMLYRTASPKDTCSHDLMVLAMIAALAFVLACATCDPPSSSNAPERLMCRMLHHVVVELTSQDWQTIRALNQIIWRRPDAAEL